ncbi:MAG TPA: LPS export ABC transporter periplasmic protein LptC [Steroidobacteraceae bacterium]
MTGRLLLLAALVALFGVLVQWRLLDREPEPPLAETGRPGYYLSGIDLEEFGADGRLRFGLQAVTAKEDPANGSVNLAVVTLDYHAPTGREWHLTSTEARLPRTGRTVAFEGDVRLSGVPDGQSEKAELHTQVMSFDTEAERAETDSPVELAFGRHLVLARGMRADLKAGSLSLEADVSGVFTP